jgi:hypothetical protein
MNEELYLPDGPGIQIEHQEEERLDVIEFEWL